MKLHTKTLLTALTAAAALAGSANAELLDNAGFEEPGERYVFGFDPLNPGDTDIPAWSNGVVNGTYGTDLFSGPESGQQRNGDWAATIQHGTTAIQTTSHAIAAGEIFTGKVWMENRGGSVDEMVLQLYATPDGGATRNVLASLSPAAAPNSYEEQTVSYTADGTFAGQMLGIEIGAGPVDEWSWSYLNVDDASLEVVPEPSSLALLGLGGLLVARRRRG